MSFVDLCDTDYSGPCGKSALGSFSAADKEDFAWRCRVSWACEDACVKDFSACPSECVQRCLSFMFVAHHDTFNVVRFLSSTCCRWTRSGSGACQAPSDYDGICSPTTSKQKANIVKGAFGPFRIDAVNGCRVD